MLAVTAATDVCLAVGAGKSDEPFGDATGAAVLVATVVAVPMVSGLWGILQLSALTGYGFSLTQTPIGRILNRQVQPKDRPTIFAVQFALPHACWLLTYPMEG